MSVEPALLASEKAATPAPKRGLTGRLARDGSIIFGSVVILFMVLIGLAAPWLGTKSPSEINPAFRNRVPGIEQTIRNDDGTTRTFTYRMGTDPTESVVNDCLQSHDHSNLFLLGSGVFPTIATGNPTLTIAALTYRASRALLKQL